jgi:putative endonuclease
LSMPACHPETSGRVRSPSAPQRTHANSSGFFVMGYVVYILQSQKDQSYYTGYSQCMESRLREYNEGSTRYTLQKRPWKLVYTETCATKKEAIKRERFLKRQRNRAFYERLISGSGGV